MKLSNLLGTKPMYYSGGSYKNGSVWLNQCIENAQFWKTKNSVNKRLFFLKGKMNKLYYQQYQQREFIEKIKNYKNYKNFLINPNIRYTTENITYINNMDLLKKELL
jgi:hypothetical protein